MCSAAFAPLLSDLRGVGGVRAVVDRIDATALFVVDAPTTRNDDADTVAGGARTRRACDEHEIEFLQL